MPRVGSVIALLVCGASADTTVCADMTEFDWTEGTSLFMKGSTVSQKRNLVDFDNKELAPLPMAEHSWQKMKASLVAKEENQATKMTQARQTIVSNSHVEVEENEEEDDVTYPRIDPSICLVSDIHFGVEVFSARFNDLANRIPNMGCTAVVLMGDLTDHGSTKELETVRNTLSAHVNGKLIYATPGNHDLQKNVKDGWAAPQLNMLDNFLSIMGEDHRTLELLQTTIVITNSELLVSKEVALESRRQTLWGKLEQSLRAASQKNQTVLLVCHRPLFLRSRTEADDSQNWPLGERNRLISMLPSSTSTHVYAGHIHKSTLITARNPTIRVNTITGTGPNADLSKPSNFARVVIEHDGTVRTEFIPLADAHGV